MHGVKIEFHQFYWLTLPNFRNPSPKIAIISTIFTGKHMQNTWKVAWKQRFERSEYVRLAIK